MYHYCKHGKSIDHDQVLDKNEYLQRNTSSQQVKNEKKKSKRNQSLKR